MAKILSKDEIIKILEIEDYCLCPDALYVLYKYNSHQYGFVGNAEQVAPLLKSVGLIEDWTGAGNEVAVEIEFTRDECDHEGNHRQITITTQLYWLDFIKDFRLSQRDVIELIATYEYNKLFNTEIEKIRSIPDVVKSLWN